MSTHSLSRTSHFDPHSRRWKLWSRVECLNAVKLACDEAREAISIKDFDMLHLVEPHIYPSVATVRQYCGSWEYAIRWSGYEPRARGKRGQKAWRETNTEDLSSLYFQ